MENIFKKRLKPIFNNTHCEAIEFRNLTIFDFIIEDKTFSFLRTLGVESISDLTIEDFKGDKDNFPTKLSVWRKWILKYEVAKEFHSIKIDKSFYGHYNEPTSFVLFFFSQDGLRSTRRPTNYQINDIVEALENEDRDKYYELGGLFMHEKLKSLEFNYKGCKGMEGRFNKLLKLISDLTTESSKVINERVEEFKETSKYEFLDNIDNVSTFQYQTGVNVWLSNFAEKFAREWERDVIHFATSVKLKSWDSDEFISESQDKLKSIDSAIEELKNKRGELKRQLDSHKADTIIETFKEANWDFSGIKIPKDVQYRIEKAVHSNTLGNQYEIDVDDLKDD